MMETMEDRVYPCDFRFDEQGRCIGTASRWGDQYADNPHNLTCPGCRGKGVERHAWYCDCPRCAGDNGEGQWHRMGVPHYCAEVEGRWWPGFGIYGTASEEAGDPPAPRGDPVTQIPERV